MEKGFNEKKLGFADHLEDAASLQRTDSDDVNHELQHGMRPRKTSDEKQAILKAAQLADPGFHWLSMRGFWFACMILVVCCCGGDTGLDATSECRAGPTAVLGPLTACFQPCRRSMA